jgi:predicted dehydrogenase
MKLAVSGCGSIGARHIGNLLALGVPASDIYAYDPSTEALDRLPPDVVRWPSAARLTPDFDAVLICTPAERHTEAIKLAIDSRVPFFVEKPATLALDDLTRAEWDTKVPNLVACNMAFRPELRTLFDRVRYTRGVEVKEISLWCHSDMRTWPGKSYADPIFEFCHEVDLALRIFADLRLERRIETHFFGVKFEAHAGTGRVSVEIQWRGPYSRGGFVRWSDGTDYRYFWSEPPTDSNRMYLDEMAHFLNVVRGRAVSCNTLSRARRVVEICEHAVAARKQAVAAW